VRRLVSSATGLLHTRLALLGNELREELARWTIAVLGACGVIALAALSLGAGSAALILGVEPENRAAAAAALALLYLCSAAYVTWRVLAVLAAKPTAFSASLEQLERDRRALVDASDTQRSALGQGAGELGRLISIGVLAYSIARRLRRAA
jgi:uncharacterized membrane protein YqjE